MKQRCICGCGKAGRAQHHCVYQQHIKARAPKGLLRLPSGAWEPGEPLDDPLGISEHRTLRALLRDERDLAWVARGCHGEHHHGVKRFRLAMLPSSVFEFAEELLGAGAGFEYLRRYYGGNDPRLDRLLEEAVQAA